MIALHHVTKSYGPLILFKDVSARFEKGRVHLVAGRNGCGKSTLLRLMGGLSACTSGDVVLDAEEPRTGYLGHATFLYPGLTAMENLAFWQRAAGLPVRREELLDMLEHVNLLPFAHSRAGVFSRGMAQRLSLARVLLTRPGILLLDEPETGLDAASRQMLAAEVDDARRRGACVLWVSHQEAARDLADVVYEVRGHGLVPAGEGAC